MPTSGPERASWFKYIDHKRIGLLKKRPSIAKRKLGSVPSSVSEGVLLGVKTHPWFADGPEASDWGCAAQDYWLLRPNTQAGDG